MTRIPLIIAVFLFAVLTFSQTVKHDIYKLTIKKGRVEKQNKQTFLGIPTTLTNNSKDTLKYFSMSCNWQGFYSVENKKLQIETVECDKNIPIILVLAPRQSKTVKIRLLISPKMDASEIKFKIGLNLMKVKKNNQKPLDFDFKEEQKKKNVVWSNEISM
jgi:hypothetical protein